jgi:hypothetical protein
MECHIHVLLTPRGLSGGKFRTFMTYTPLSVKIPPSRLRLKRDGTSLREEAGVKGKPENGVDTQLMKRERDRSQLAQRYYHVTTTMCTLYLLAPD